MIASPYTLDDVLATRNDFEADCLQWRGRVLTGKHAHCCPDWDGLPIDETTPEWPCVCCRNGACGVPV